MRVGLVVLLRLLLLVSQLPFGWGLGAAELACWAAQSTAPPMTADAKPVIVIQAYNDGLAGVRVGNPDIHLSLGRDPSVSEEHVLLVEYRVPTKDPAGRDVQCAAEHQDWTSGRAIIFQIKPTHSVKLSLSFIDRIVSLTRRGEI